MIMAIAQLPLLHIVHEDDQLLLNDPKAEWYRILASFPWQSHRELAAAYYNALYHFNQSQVQHRQQPERACTHPQEHKSEAEQRLMFERPTLDEHAPVLYQQADPPSLPPTIDPESLAPGIVPLRLAGREPKCFFALFLAFIGATLMGFPPEPEQVYLLLSTNLSFARVCGFIPKGPNDPYWHKHIPSLRKLEQFDQIMTEYGLWSRQKWEEVCQNITSGVIQPENELVADTTHYHAYSSFKTVTYQDEKGEEHKKSQSKVTKTCQCPDKEQCHHPWELVDDGAGTIVKSSGKKYWGHKSSIVGLPKQGIPLDAVAVADAATHDSRTVVPHLERLFDHLPQVQPWIERILYDSAADSEALRQQIHETFGMDLKSTLNPRRKKEITENLPRGMTKLTPQGEIFCQAGHAMDYQGARFGTERFIYGPPHTDEGDRYCDTCTNKALCCPHATKGRTVTVAFELLPQIDSEDPPMAKRFKAIMSRRPSIERMIKRLKCDLSDDRLTKRGNASFQAYLDKTMIAFHVLLRD